MEGEEERSENEGSFSKASIPKRIAIVIAGATVNIIFGLLVYFILMSTGATYVTNEISTVLDGYAAQETGLQQNDKIVELNGKKIKKEAAENQFSSDFPQPVPYLLIVIYNLMHCYIFFFIDSKCF